MEMKTKLILTGVGLMALTAFAFSQDPGTGKNLRNGTGRGPAYVDINKNDTCDNYENNTANFDQHRRNGTNYRSAHGQHAGQRLGRNQGRGRGQGRNFVDADKNGVCDYYEAATKK
jgi:hypothetical protein